MITENGHGTGAIQSEKSKDIPLKEIMAGDSMPFDWNIGFDVRDVLLHKTGTRDIPVKNQGSSGSCGGQAWAYAIGILDALRDGKYEEKSARYIYAPCRHGSPAGGSCQDDLVNRIMKVGASNESLVPSYNCGNPPDEQYMEMTGDFNDVALQNALEDKGLKPVYLNEKDIDSLAQAIRDDGCFVMGIQGENNGTWLSTFPKPPVNSNGKWAHWVCFIGAQTINGIKYLLFINSWGKEVGQNGVQMIEASYLVRNTFNACSMILVNPPKVVYTFNITLKLGDNNSDVAKLQTKLKQLGFFLQDQAITNYFGNLTKKAVMDFQIKNNITPVSGIVGNLTRNKLNSL